MNESLRAKEPLTLEFHNDLGALAAARERVRDHLHENGVDDAAVYAVDLAIEELVSNTLRYGYERGVEGSIRVGLSIAPDKVRITIVDDARPFDPTRHPEPAPPSTLSHAPLGGRGISMVRRFVSAMHHRATANGNRIEIEIARTRR